MLYFTLYQYCTVTADKATYLASVWQWERNQKNFVSRVPISSVQQTCSVIEFEGNVRINSSFNV